MDSGRSRLCASCSHHQRSSARGHCCSEGTRGLASKASPPRRISEFLQCSPPQQTPALDSGRSRLCASCSQQYLGARTCRNRGPSLQSNPKTAAADGGPETHASDTDTDTIRVFTQCPTVRHTAFMGASSAVRSLGCEGVWSHLRRHSESTPAHIVVVQGFRVKGATHCRQGVQSHLRRHSEVAAAHVAVVLLGELASTIALHKMHDLRRQPGGRARIHLIARLHELLSNGEIIWLPTLPRIHPMHVP